MSLRLRIALLSAIGVVIAAGITSMVLARDMRRHQEQMVHRCLIGAGQHLARLDALDLTRLNAAALKKSARIEVGTLIDSVDIIDRKGVDLADTSHDSYTAEKKAVIECLRTGRPVVGHVGLSSSGVVPVKGPDGRLVGAIVMHIGLRKEQSSLAESRAKAVAIITGGSAVGLALAYILSAVLIAPLRSVVNGMRRVAAGEGSSRIDPPSTPELRDVVEGFNVMSLAVTKRARNLELLNAMAAEIAIASQLPEIAESVGRTSGEMLEGKSRLWVFDNHNEKLESVPEKGHNEKITAERWCPVSKVARESRLMTIGDGYADLPSGSRLSVNLPPVGAAVLVPLQTPDGVVGTLSVEGLLKQRSMTYGQIATATTIANIVGPVIATHMRAESQARSARMLQNILVPEVPMAIPGVDVAVKYQPAEEMGRIGGDFYDFIKFSDSEWSVIVGDVSGKGLSAAQHAATARYALRSYLFEYRATDQAMTLTNSAVATQLEGENFITVFCGVLNLNDCTLRYVRAGHPPAVIYNKMSGSVRHLAAPGVATGIASDEQYEEAVEKLSADDTLVIFTDGLTEARSGADVFGEQRLDEQVIRYAHLPVQLMAESIINEVTSFSGGRLTDDAALIVIRLQ